MPMHLSNIAAAVIAAALPVVGCIDRPNEQEIAQQTATPIDDGYDYDTPCGTDGGPGCSEGWCTQPDGCSTGYSWVCNPIFLAGQCMPELAPQPPMPAMCTVTVGELHTVAPEGGSLLSTHVIAADAADMTGWVDSLGDKGKVKIKTDDGSISASYTVVKKTKDEIEIKVTGGGLLADFDPNDPLVVRLYNACGKQKYATTGTLRIIGGKKVPLKAGPDDVDVTRAGTGVITIKQGGQEITITPKAGGATLDGGGAKMDFTKQ